MTERQFAYTASEWGNKYHSLQCREALGGGAAGPGKSWVLLADIIPRLQIEHDRATNPKNPHYFGPGNSEGWALQLRRTVKQIEQTIARSQRLFKAVDPGAYFESSKSTWHFTSGYKYQFGHCVHSNSWNDYFSSAFDWIGFDEAIQFEEDQYRNIAARCRSADPVLRHHLKVRLMSNPQQRQESGDEFSYKGDPNWLRDYFIKPYLGTKYWPDAGVPLRRTIRMSDGTTEVRERIFMPARLSDNPDKSFARQYEADLRSTLKPHQLRALLDGDWWVTAGSYFGAEWIQSLHVCAPFKLWPDCRIARSMDWGHKKPGCVHWGALDREDTLWVFKELTFQGKMDFEVADLIKDAELRMGLWDKKRNRSKIVGVADPQLWERRGDSGKGKDQVFAERGILWTPADRRSRRANAERVSKRLKDHGHGTKTPGLVIFNCCPKLIETLPSIQTAPDGETPVDGGPDHWFDSLGYLVAHASNGLAGFGMAPVQRDDEDDRIVLPSRGRDGYGGQL